MADENMAKRLALLIPTRDSLQDGLRNADLGLLANRAGGSVDEGMLTLDLLSDDFMIRWPEVRVYADDGAEARIDLQVLLLTYLRNADGSRPMGSWLSLRELPDGGFYHRAFQGYAPDLLARRYGEDLQAFRLAAEATCGRKEPMGTASYSYLGLPNVRLAAVLWEGDEEFPSAARILFDEACSRYLATDLLATLGRMLVSKLLKAQPAT